jgi:hypothetical protein
MLISVHLEIVLILMQDRCTVCAKCTTGLKIVLDTPDRILGDMVMWYLISVRLETVLVSVRDRCTFCAKCAIGSEIILDTLIGTPR